MYNYAIARLMAILTCRDFSFIDDNFDPNTFCFFAGLAGCSMCFSFLERFSLSICLWPSRAYQTLQHQYTRCSSVNFAKHNVFLLTEAAPHCGGYHDTCMGTVWCTCTRHGLHGYCMIYWYKTHIKEWFFRNWGRVCQLQILLPSEWLNINPVCRHNTTIK